MRKTDNRTGYVTTNSKSRQENSKHLKCTLSVERSIQHASDSPIVWIVTTRHLSQNPRVVKEAWALSEAGFAVTIITRCDTPRFEAWDREILLGADWELRAVRVSRQGIHRFRWFRDAVRHHRASRRWARGIRDEATLTRAIGRAVPELIHKGTIGRKPDLIIAHHADGLVAGNTIASRLQVPLGFDAEDFHPGELSPGDASSHHELVTEAMRRCLPSCRGISVSSKPIARELERQFDLNARPMVIHNTFPQASFPSPPIQPGDPVRIYWCSQTIGPDRGLDRLLKALCKIQTPWELSLRGSDHLGHGQQLRNLAASHQCPERLILLPPANPSQLTALTSAYDLMASVETGPKMNYRINAPNKLFQGMSAGLGILFSGTEGQHNVMDLAPSAGCPLPPDGSPEDWSHVLIPLFQDFPRINSMKQAAYQAAQSQFSDQSERRKIIDLWRPLTGPGLLPSRKSKR